MAEEQDTPKNTQNTTPKKHKKVGLKNKQKPENYSCPKK